MDIRHSPAINIEDIEAESLLLTAGDQLGTPATASQTAAI